MASGYTNCACRDCFDIAVSSDTSKPELCSDCEQAGCMANDGECQRDDAYGTDELCEHGSWVCDVAGCPNHRDSKR